MKIPLVVLCPLLLLGCQPKHSPEADETAPGSAEKQPSAAMPNPDSFVGLTLAEAEAKAEKADLPHRIVRKDGQDLPVTRDYRPERLNFEVEKGVVTKVSNG